MGNLICGAGRRGPVEERLTKPQRLARQPSNVDYRKLRKLILSRKLAPCFDALEDPAADLEECPICFFHYPSLNRSRCCSKGICTECFLQMKPSSAARPAQCPFCKTSRYAVEYRGARSKEEKERELAEEQKVMEAKTRMHSQDLNMLEQTVEVNRNSLVYNLEFMAVQSPRLCEEALSPVESRVPRDLASALMLEDSEVVRSVDPDICNARFEQWDLDLEEIMVMEAIWQSLQHSKSRAKGIAEACGAGERSEQDQSRPPCPSLGQSETCSSRARSLPEPAVEDFASPSETSEASCDCSRIRADSDWPGEYSGDGTEGGAAATDIEHRVDDTIDIPSCASACDSAAGSSSSLAEADETESCSSDLRSQSVLRRRRRPTRPSPHIGSDQPGLPALHAEQSTMPAMGII